MADLRRQLERLLESGGRAIEPLLSNRLVIYGGGNCGRGVAKTARAAGFEPVAFVDARAEYLTNVDGMPCYAPSSDAARKLAGDGMAVVIGVFNHATNVAPIAHQLRQMGFRQVVSYQEFYELFGVGSDFWLTRRSFYDAKAKEVLEGFDLFADEESRRVYHETLEHRLNLGSDLLQEPDLENQYLPSDLPSLSRPVRLIDGGAFTGDTLESFLKHKVQIQAVVAFEPDTTNYRKLEATVARLSDSLGAVTLFPCGLSEASGVQSFSSGGSSGSALNPGGTASIQVAALDDVVSNFAPTFIKLDIEGAEPLALRGGRKLIEKHQPRLAICAYHKPDHLWTIAQLIHSLQPRYQLALRYHQWNGFDSVVYAF